MDHKLANHEKALRLAVELGLESIVELMLEKGVKIDLQRKSLNNPISLLHLAVAAKNDQIVELLLKHEAKTITALSQIRSIGDPDLVKKIISFMPDINRLLIRDRVFL